MASVTKADLVSAMATETGLKKVDCEKAVTAFTSAVQGALAEGKKVTLVGFGTFLVAERAARTGRDPRTRAEIQIPAKKVVKFRPGLALRDAVDE